MLTTRMDGDDDWNDYWEYEGSSWNVVFPWLIVHYLSGETADANFNYFVGQSVTVPLPKEGVPKGTKVVIVGPPEAIVGTDALIEVGDRQTELRIGPPKTNQPGNYALTVEARKWQDGFSLNVPSDESNLDKAAVEAIEDLTGKNSVVPVDKNRDLRSIMDIVMGSPVDLFPWLLIMVLLLLAIEGLVANRFYRRVR